MASRRVAPDATTPDGVAGRLRNLGLTPPQARRLQVALRPLSGRESPVVRMLDELAGNRTEAAPLDELLPIAEIVVEVCIREATSDGRYPLERARTVGRIAQALGLSAGRLREIESIVLGPGSGLSRPS
jgi:hypothetical protein